MQEVTFTLASKLAEHKAVQQNLIAEHQRRIYEDSNSRRAQEVFQKESARCAGAIGAILEVATDLGINADVRELAKEIVKGY